MERSFEVCFYFFLKPTTLLYCLLRLLEHQRSFRSIVGVSFMHVHDHDGHCSHILVSCFTVVFCLFSDGSEQIPRFLPPRRHRGKWTPTTKASCGWSGATTTVRTKTVPFTTAETLTPIICRYVSVGVDAGGKECEVDVVELTTLF